MDLVDLYTFQMQVSSLLKMSRVVRYGSLESWMPELGTEAYQRLLNPHKLKAIRDFLRREREKSSFPNAITVVLSQNVERDGNDDDLELVIPLQYGSMEIIDGQHRLFGFAKCGMRTDQLDEAKLLVTGVHFRNCPERKRQQWSARAFIEINRSQTKVPTELMQLIANSVMNERSPSALAARALVDLNVSPRGILEDVFHTRPFQKHNRVGGRPVRIVTVTKELARLFDKRNVGHDATRGIYETFSEAAWRKLERGHQTSILSESKRAIGEYFRDVSNMFRSDWGSKESLIFTSKYLAAFCKFFIECRRNRMERNQIQGSLRRMRDNIREYFQTNHFELGPNGEYLWVGNAESPELPGALPPARGSFSDIFDFITKMAG